MLERTSALANTEPLELPGLRLSEARGFSLLQVARPSKAALAHLGTLPDQVGRAVGQGDLTLMKIGPDRYWVVGPEQQALERELQGKAMLTSLSHSRTRVLIEGAMAREVLLRCAAVDFSPGKFGPQTFAMTGIHHTPVLVHCIAEQAFHIYILRTFGLSIWEWLVHAAEGMQA